MNIFKKIYCRVFQFAFVVALPVLPYREPKIFDSMEKLVKALKHKEKNCILIVTDKSITNLGLYKPLLELLDKADIKYVIYDDTVPNPTIANVEAARQAYIDAGCQAIIGFGGGSAIDCAKAAGARIAKPKQSIPKMKGILKIGKKLPLLIAIPTTAGTGSEATVAAVITDEKTHYKYPVNDFPLIPSCAVHDYKVTVGLPKHITATTGMDALVHAVEAYIGGNTNKFTRAMSEETVCLVRDYLKRAYENGEDIDPRKNMLRAAYCGGVAFTRSYVGYVHGIAHSLGGQYGTPHGLANAVILPYFLEEYGACCEKKLGKLARKCEIADKNASDHDASVMFIKWVKEMNAYLNIPEKIEGIREEDIPMMAKYADKESNPLYPVPKLMNAKELEKMYRRISA